VVYNEPIMDRYSLERWTLERHERLARTAEEDSRLRGWALQPRLAGLVAARLRLMADRLDGRDGRDRTFTVVSGSG
jgi:hypothetical protein